MSTRQRILNEALTLFAEKGFIAVTVNDIAEAVGIKAPSLYKHFKNKQDIFDSCIEMFLERLEGVRNNMFLNNITRKKDFLETPDRNAAGDFALNLFLFYLKDEVAAKIRRVLSIDRYRSASSNELYEAMFITNAVRIEEKLFASLMEGGVMTEGNPHNRALQFYAPILYLVNKYEMHPELEEEAIQEAKAVINEFYDKYTIKK